MTNKKEYMEYRKLQLEIKKLSLESQKIREELISIRLKQKALLFTLGFSAISLIMSLLRGR